MKLIMENWKKFINEQEQLEIPGIPAGDPDQRAESLETAKIFLQSILRTGDATIIPHLVHAAERHVDGLASPLPGVKSARTRLMMRYDRDINPEIAQQIINILKQNEKIKAKIDRSVDTLKQVAAYGEDLDNLLKSPPVLEMTPLEREYLTTAAQEAWDARQEQRYAAELDTLKE